MIYKLNVVNGSFPEEPFRELDSKIEIYKGDKIKIGKYWFDVVERLLDTNKDELTLNIYFYGI